MRIYHTDMKDTMIHSYNDSGCEWAIFSQGHPTIRFPMSKGTTMKAAIQMYAEMFHIEGK